LAHVFGSGPGRGRGLIESSRGSSKLPLGVGPAWAVGGEEGREDAGHGVPAVVTVADETAEPDGAAVPATDMRMVSASKTMPAFHSSASPDGDAAGGAVAGIAAGAVVEFGGGPTDERGAEEGAVVHQVEFFLGDGGGFGGVGFALGAVGGSGSKPLLPMPTLPCHDAMTSACPFLVIRSKCYERSRLLRAPGEMLEGSIKCRMNRDDAALIFGEVPQDREQYDCAEGGG